MIIPFTATCSGCSRYYSKTLIKYYVGFYEEINNEHNQIQNYYKK